jgi:hypothetical protein
MPITTIATRPMPAQRRRCAQNGFARDASLTFQRSAALSPPRATPSAQRVLCLRSATRATKTRSRRPISMCLMAPMSAAPNMRAAVSIGRAWEIQAGRSVCERHNHACWISMPGRTLRSTIPARCALAIFPALGMSRVKLRLSSRARREARGSGDIRLHFIARQRLDAGPNRKGLA